ncbi:tyrosine-protein phosphatase [Paenalcaligenes sp. Me131]|uniref:tyrosine-protein phosphatase n=1 Tax=Paenalcaligenes sp. Me131 TaxID=3392636 RepID=UPI003D28C829
MDTEQNVQGQRAVAFEGVTNFRDLGGYQGVDGGRVRWQTLYRSAHLADLTAADQQQLQGLQVNQSIDLRGQFERQKKPYNYQFLQHTVCGIEPEVARLVDGMVQQHGHVTPVQASQYMQSMYHDFHENNQAHFSQCISTVCAASEPLVVHCTAGKDRTGFASALLLSMLGVHRDDILADYMLTQQYYHRSFNAEYGMSEAVMRILWGVSAQYLEQSFTELDAQYGSVMNYVSKGLNIKDDEVAQLRDRLLV